MSDLFIHTTKMVLSDPKTAAIGLPFTITVGPPLSKFVLSQDASLARSESDLGSVNESMDLEDGFSQSTQGATTRRRRGISLVTFASLFLLADNSDVSKQQTALHMIFTEGHDACCIKGENSRGGVEVKFRKDSLTGKHTSPALFLVCFLPRINLKRTCNYHWINNSSTDARCPSFFDRCATRRCAFDITERKQTR